RARPRLVVARRRHARTRRAVLPQPRCPRRRADAARTHRRAAVALLAAHRLHARSRPEPPLDSGADHDAVDPRQRIRAARPRVLALRGAWLAATVARRARPDGADAVLHPPGD